jgi:hypothetical protein
MSAADDFPEIAHVAAGHGCLVIEDLEAQAQMVLAEIDVLRRKVGLREAELAAAEVALRQLGYQGAMTR